MNLSRETQLKMLEALADAYTRLTEHIGVDFTDDDNLANLWYLKEQGLVEGKFEMAMDQTFVFQGVRITAKGIDFLADDGGVSAILGTVTVRCTLTQSRTCSCPRWRRHPLRRNGSPG